MSWQRWCLVVVMVVMVAVVVLTAGTGTQEMQPFSDLARAARVGKEERREGEKKKEKEEGRSRPRTIQSKKHAKNTNTTSESPAQGIGEELLPRSDQCGKRSKKGYRIYFGEDAPLSVYPWMALLGYKNVSHPKWKCGGSLINSRYVLTAGHCVHPLHTKKSSVGALVAVRLGEHDLTTNPDCPSTGSNFCASPYIDFFPDSVIIHEDFDTKVLLNDIALVRLHKPVTFSTSIHPLCLPPPGLNIKEFLGSRDAVVAGWGITEDMSNSNILQRAPVPLADKKKCEKKYFVEFADSQLCFGGRGKIDACFGDSGGPLMQAKQGSPRYTLLGVVSYGKKVCGIPGTPGVYTNVSHYRKWIVSKLIP